MSIRSQYCWLPRVHAPARTLAALSILALAGVAAPALAQTFTYTYFPSNTTVNTPLTTDFSIIGFSGGQYNEDTFAREFTGPSSPTVQIADGADIPDAEIFNHSIVNMTGGTAGLFAYDDSTVNIHGGEVFFALSNDNSVVNMYAGRVGDLEGQGRRINVYGGIFTTLVANTNTSYTGDPLGSCIVDVFGGTFEAGGDLTAFNDGILNLRGGLIQSDFIRAAEGGTLSIFGTGLAAQLINPNGANGYSIYTLSGSDAALGKHLAGDYRSAHGVFVNDKQITLDVVLNDGDRIKIGQTTLMYLAKDHADAPAALAAAKKMGEWKRTTLLGPS